MWQHQPLIQLVAGFKPISSGKGVAFRFNFSYSAGVVSACE